MLEKNKQIISNADNSSVQQAQGDIHNIIFVGNTSLAEIIREVVKSELNIVTKEAYEKFNQLIDEFRNRLADEIGKLKNPQELVNKFNEPKFQFILHDTIKEYAQSNDETLKEDLIDILIERLQVNNNSVLQFVIEDAIHILPKLTLPTSQLLAAMFLRFLKENCTSNFLYSKLNTYATIYENLDKITNLDIEYLKQLNCCTSLLDLKHMEPIETEMRIKYDLFFRKPVNIDDFHKFVNLNDTLKTTPDVYSYFYKDDKEHYRCLFTSIESMRNNLEKNWKNKYLFSYSSVNK